MEPVMNPESDFDLIRALVEGRLAPADAAALESRIAADADLAAFRDDYALVHGLTAPLAGLDVTSELRFEDVAVDGPEDPAAPRSLRWSPRTRAAAAAVLISLSVLAGYRFLPPRPAEAVTLSAIPLDEAPVTAAVRLPAALASYRPSDGDRIVWLDSLDQGRELAALSGRPVLVFSEYPGCPFCLEMSKVAFRDEDVLDVIDALVPVKVNLQKVTPEELEFYWKQYPYFAVQDPSGKELHVFPGMQSGESLLTGVQDGLAHTADRPAPLSWERTDRLAGLLSAATDAEAEGRLDEAWTKFGELTAATDAPHFSDAGAAGRARLSQAARGDLRAAQALAAQDPVAAERALRAAAERFEHTPLAADFDATLGVLEATGRFPRLEESHR